MILRASLCFVTLCAPLGITYAVAQPANSAPAGAGGATGRTGATLQPAVQLVKEALSTITVDKWKASAAIKSDADANLRSVQHDIDATLPGLVTAADAAPDSPAKGLPVFRNVDALYDVMLRLDAAGRLAAPKDQIGALDDALSSIATARRTLGDQLQASADAQEQRLIRLQQAAARPTPAPAPVAVACVPPPPPAAKKKRTTAAKPTTAAAH